jgi:hypothetical protein
LRAKELCPIHRRRDCCGRSEFTRYAKPKHELKFKIVRPGVKRYPDGREVCSLAEKRRIKNTLLREHPFCAVCDQRFDDYADVELGHKESKGAGGFRADDRKSNLCLLHYVANRDMGSRNLDEYMNDIQKAGKKFPCEVQ